MEGGGRESVLDWVAGVVVAGHGVASGCGGDVRFPGGTLGMQRPVFARLGLDLSGYHHGTVNVSVAPRRVRMVAPRWTFREVEWKAGYPAEDFSFADVWMEVGGGERVAGLVYWPHPETKPEHFQADGVVEVLAPWVEGVAVGVGVRLGLVVGQVAVEDWKRS